MKNIYSAIIILFVVLESSTNNAFSQNANNPSMEREEISDTENKIIGDAEDFAEKIEEPIKESLSRGLNDISDSSESISDAAVIPQRKADKIDDSDAAIEKDINHLEELSKGH